MNIINTYEHRLVFRIDNDASKEYMDRWKEFKLNCESGESGPSTPGKNKYILEQIKESCILKQIKELPYLQRCEGGLGGNNDIENKQIRFRYYRYNELWSKNPMYIDNEIIMEQITDGEKEIWTYEELDDIIYGFIKTANEIMESECINGCIELKNKNGYQNLDSVF